MIRKYWYLWATFALGFVATLAFSVGWSGVVLAIVVWGTVTATAIYKINIGTSKKGAEQWARRL